MSWQEKFDNLFFPYLMEKAVLKNQSCKKQELTQFLKKILKDDYETNTLLTIYFVLDEENNLIINRDIKQLINTLNISSYSQKIVRRGYIKGKMFINSTIKEYRIKQRNPSNFICKEINRDFNTPENKLLKYVLFELKKLYLKLPKNLIVNTEEEASSVESSFEKYEEPKEMKNERFQVISQIILDFKNSLFRLLNNVKIKGIETPKSVTNKMIDCAIKARNPLYKKVLKLYQKYKNLFLIDEINLDLLIKILDFKKIIPTSIHKQFEIFILILTIRSLELSPRFKLEKFGLINSNRDYITKFNLDSDLSIKLFYDMVPKSIISEYKKILENYNLKSVTRRPDIIFELKDEYNNRMYYFVEVKNTQDKKYIVDSVYKCLAYLYDFKGVVIEDLRPKISLVLDFSSEIFHNYNVQTYKTKDLSINIISWKHLFEINDIMSSILENFEKKIRNFKYIKK